MSEKRKQSLNDDQIIERSKSSKLPAAGAPPIANFPYDGAPANELPEDINEQVGPVITLPAPRNMEIVSQTIRFAPDGTQYVTVVVEFDEVEGADSYESRLAKL